MDGFPARWHRDTVRPASTDSSQMKPEPPETEKNLSADLKTFEKLPNRTRELLLLGDEVQKATGTARAEADEKITPQPKLTKQ